MLKSTGPVYAPVGTDVRRMQSGAHKQEDTAISIDTSIGMDRSTHRALVSGADIFKRAIDPAEAPMHIAYAPGKSDYRHVWRTSLDSARSNCIPVSLASLCLTHLTLVVSHLTGCVNIPKEEDRHSGVVQNGLVVLGGMVVGPIVAGGVGLVKNFIKEVSNTHDCNQLKTKILQSMEVLKNRSGWNPAFSALMSELPRAWKGEKNAHFLEGLSQLTCAMEKSQALADFVFLAADSHLSLNVEQDPAARQERTAQLARAFSIEAFHATLKTQFESCAPGSQERQDLERQLVVMRSFDAYWEDERDPTAVPGMNEQAQLYQALCGEEVMQFFRVPATRLDAEPLSPIQLAAAYSKIQHRFEQTYLNAALAQADAGALS